MPCIQSEKTELVHLWGSPCESQKKLSLLFPVYRNVLINLTGAYSLFPPPLTSEWEKSLSQFSQDHLPCVWSQANLSAWKTETVWAKESLYFGNESTGFGKQWQVTPEAPSQSAHLSTVPTFVSLLQTAGLESGMSKGPSHFPFPWTSKNHRNSQSWERSQ